MLATLAEAQRERWDNQTELLAALVELVAQGNRIAHAAWLKGSPPEPVVVNRPTHGGAEESQERRPATAAEMKAFFGGVAEVSYTP